MQKVYADSRKHLKENPQEIFTRHQTEPEDCDQEKLEKAIQKYGSTISKDQVLSIFCEKHRPLGW